MQRCYLLIDSFCDRVDALNYLLDSPFLLEALDRNCLQVFFILFFNLLKHLFQPDLVIGLLDEVLVLRGIEYQCRIRLVLNLLAQLLLLLLHSLHAGLHGFNCGVLALKGDSQEFFDPLRQGLRVSLEPVCKVVLHFSPSHGQAIIFEVGQDLLSLRCSSSRSRRILWICLCGLFR